MEITQLELKLIDEDLDQPRYQFDEAALQELMNSIEELGLLSPIKVRKTGNDRYKIIYGNRRYKAAMRLGKTTIPCIISDAMTDMDIYLEQIAENLTREGFSPIEEAEAFDKLLNDPKFRSSTKFLSAKLGKTEKYIKNKCELLKFSSSVKKLIVSGTEIRKNCLTEEQLLPLKDLQVEHRDALALIAARDELPVSDVKKIAKLFKDETLSDKIKEKLLLKDGPGLIETWSTREQNKKERARAAAEAAKLAEQAEQDRQLKEEQAHKEHLANAHSSTIASSPQAAITTTIATVAASESPNSEAILALAELVNATKLPAMLEQHTKDLLSVAHGQDLEQIEQQITALIDQLKQQLTYWSGVHEDLTGNRIQ